MDLARRLHFRVPVAIFGAFLCVAALVGASPPSGARGATGSPAGPAQAKAWRAPKLTWEACEGAPGVQCATLRVPLDWSRSRGAEVSLALTRLPATDPKRRIGTVVFNCGGPGCPAAQVVKLRPGLFTPALRQRFDVVGFDPRGTGDSTPVRCGLAPDPSVPIFPRTESQYQRLLRFNRALARSCERLTGPYLMHVGAVDVVRDMEAIREALRDGKLNWLGLSYGTMLGSEYAERYPRRIRAMVLDGALDRALSEPGMLAEEARTSEDVFVRWAAWCHQSSKCPLHGRDVLGVWDRLIATANRSPIPATGVPGGVTGVEIQGTADANYLLFQRPNPLSQPSWLSLGPAIVKALHGDASDFVGPVPPPSPTNPAYGVRAISCLDWPTHVHNLAEFKNEITIAGIIAPHLGGATQTLGIISQCLGWPRPRTDPRRFLHIEGTPPALIVNALHDPSTSYTWALNLQAQMPGSVLLTRDGDGHTSYLSSPCAQKAIDRYLTQLALPRPGAVCHS
jgi:pimeloyl-ACP methyl ester carboxylesterase